MIIYIAFGIFVVLGGWVTWYYFEYVRVSRLQSRFLNRSRIPISQQIESRLGRDSGQVERGWLFVSERLGLDPEVLRPDDRFDGILREIPGFPMETGLHDVSEEIFRIVSKTKEETKIETFWDAALLIGEGSDIFNRVGGYVRIT